MEVSKVERVVPDSVRLLRVRQAAEQYRQALSHGRLQGTIEPKARHPFLGRHIDVLA